MNVRKGFTKLFALSALVALTAVLGSAGAVLAALPQTLLTDPQGITGFELYGTGLYWWETPGRCGGEFPNPATIRVRGITTGSTKNLANTCEIMQDLYAPNVARDDAYVYFFKDGQLQRKALNAAESDPSLPVPTPPFAPTLSGNQLSSNLLLADGYLFWGQFNNATKVLSIYRMKTDGSTSALWFTQATNAAPIIKMRWFHYVDSGGAGHDALAWLQEDGKLYQWSSGGFLSTVRLLDTGIRDFAIHTRYILLGNPVTSVYAATTAIPGTLWQINPDTGALTNIYNGTGQTQIESVTTDSAQGPFGPTKNIYIAEDGLTGCDILCTVTNVSFKRHTVPGADDGHWELFVATGGGGNLRSDDQWLYFISFPNPNSIMRIKTDAPPVQLDFQADSLEVVQTIQNLAIDEPLVADKPTFVRGYAHIQVNTTGTSSFFVSASLRGFHDGVEFADSPLDSINSPTIDATTSMATRRPLLNRSFLFQLPMSWMQAGSLTLEMTVNSSGALPETGTATNKVTLAKAAQVFNKGDPCLITVRMRTDPTIATTPAGLPQIISRARSLLPVHNLNVYSRADIIEKPVVYVEWDWEVCFPFMCYLPIPHIRYDPFDLPDDKDWALFWLTMWDQLSSWEPEACDGTVSHLVGMVDPIGGDGFNGIGNGPPFVVSDDVVVRMEPGAGGKPAWNSPLGGRTLAHELGHNYGRAHIDQTIQSALGCGGKKPDGPYDDPPFDHCTIGPTGAADFFGFDPISQSVISPTMAGDLMSYAPTRWTSAFTWDALFGQTPFNASARSSTPLAISLPATQTVLLVDGVITPTQNSGSFGRFYQFPGGAAPATKVARSLVASAQAGLAADPYVIRLLDSNLVQLAEIPVTILNASDSSPQLHFVQYIPYNNQTRRIQLAQGTTVLTEQSVSANAPTLTLALPIVDPGTQTLSLSWAATDADRDLLTFTVQYSSDDGAHWQTLEVEHPWLALTVSTKKLPGSSQARLRVIATDGVNSTLAVTPPFTLAKHAPEPQIGGVMEGQRLPYGQPAQLDGLVLDAEQGSLPATSLNWSLSGPTHRVASGSSLSLLDLSPGVYSATLSASDSDGQQGVAQRNFEVMALAVPDGMSPVMDGICGDAGYASAPTVRLPLGSNQFAHAWLVHADGNLFVCFSDLKLAGGTSSRASVGLRIDANASRDSIAQPGDIGFYVDQEGIPYQVMGNGSDMPITLSPLLGYSAVIERTPNGWNAELKIDEKLLGGWSHAAGFMLSPTGLTTPNDEQKWPPSAVSTSPATWAPAYFGTPPAPSNRPPVADAGEDLIVNLAMTRTVTLNGGGSFDPDGDSLSFAWTQVSGPPVALHQASTAMPSFVATPVSTATQLRFRLVVHDGSFSSSPSETVVTLLPTPLPPPAAPFRQIFLPLIRR